jgi:hypothetical protein
MPYKQLPELTNNQILSIIKNLVDLTVNHVYFFEKTITIQINFKGGKIRGSASCRFMNITVKTVTMILNIWF